jgi:hypothetical protein
MFADFSDNVFYLFKVCFPWHPFGAIFKGIYRLVVCAILVSFDCKFNT